MRKEYGIMVFVNVMWGMSFIFSKHAMNAGFSTMALAFVRYVLTAAVLLPTMLASSKHSGKRFWIKKRDIQPMLLSSLTGITIYYLCEYNGLQRTSTVSASLILATIPILTMLAEAVLLHTRLQALQSIGAFVSLIGVALVVLSSAGEGENSTAGNLFILGASVVWVAYIFLSRRLRKRYSSLEMNAWQAIFAAFSLFPLAMGEHTDFSVISWDGWCSAAVLAVVCSALCYYLYGNALAAMSPMASAIFINLIPLTTMVGGVVFLGESLSWQIAVGGLLIIGSIFLVTLAEHRKNVISAPSGQT